MARRRIRNYLCFLCCIASIITTLLVYISGNGINIFRTNTNIVNFDNGSQRFLVDTTNCKIPNMDPWDKSIRNIVMKVKELKCPGPDALTYMVDNKLKISSKVFSKHYKKDNVYMTKCTYQAIIRNSEKSDNVYKINKPVEFKDDIDIEEEFILVKCFNKTEKVFYKNYHATIIRKKDVESRCTKIVSDTSNELLNIMMVGVDSVSRLNFIRQMPKTRQYLLKNLKGIELKGYNKVADNTFVNIVPMLVGKLVEELPWNETMKKKPFDKYNMAWKGFSKNGYRTLFAEDHPYISGFNYLKAGFWKQPTDYYLRPYTLALEDDHDVWNNDQHCIGSKLEAGHILDWMYDFSTEFQSDPYFAFSFITRLTHDNINNVGRADKPHLQFIKRLHKNGNLNNTVMIYFSDHGFRFGSIRSTYIGKLEERLPFMILVFPDWFYNKYPNLAANLRTNSHRLTTPFDIHATLMDLLDFKKTQHVKSRGRGVSVLREIPEDRSCNDAGIAPHWCTCQNKEKADLKDPKVIKAANNIIQHINQYTKSNRKQCVSLNLHSIRDAYKVAANEKVLTYKSSLNDVIDRKVVYGERAKGAMEEYLITLKASPSDALFEATVQFTDTDNKFTILGDISRINKYGDQSKCVKNYRMKKFCYCH